MYTEYPSKKVLALLILMDLPNFTSDANALIHMFLCASNIVTRMKTVWGMLDPPNGMHANSLQHLNVPPAVQSMIKDIPDIYYQIRSCRLVTIQDVMLKYQVC